MRKYKTLTLTLIVKDKVSNLKSLIGVLLRTYFMDDANKRCKKDTEEGEK